jgi:predicted dehydrogenase
MLNAAIIGLGWWGKRLVGSVQGSRLIRFARGVTLEPEAVRDFAAANGLAIGTSFEDVLADPAIDAVVLATPHSRHRAQVEAAAAARKHIYCEKPFALTKADAQAMLGACARAGITIAVGHHFRLMPSMTALRRKSRPAASARSCMWRAITATTGWRRSRRTAGGRRPKRRARAA